MLFFAINQDAKRLELLCRAIEEAEPNAQILASTGFEAARAALDRREMPDAVFLDAGQWEPEGRKFVETIKKRSPVSRILLIADSDAYVKEAYALGVEKYLIRPFRREEIREELILLSQMRKSGASGEGSGIRKGADKIRVRCFGYFAVFWRGQPLVFNRKKTMELLAFLVDRRGACCSAEEVIDALYEDTPWEKMQKAKQNFRNLVFDLKSNLARIGQEALLIRTRSAIGICPELLDCDYYRLLAGDSAARAEFAGEYMEQYTWAENTKGRLVFHGGKSEREETFSLEGRSGEPAAADRHRRGGLENFQLPGGKQANGGTG